VLPLLNKEIYVISSILILFLEIFFTYLVCNVLATTSFLAEIINAVPVV
jgi:hypothetical protein